MNSSTESNESSMKLDISEEFHKYFEIGKKHEFVMNKVEETFYDKTKGFYTSYDIKAFIEEQLKTEIYHCTNLYDTTRLQQGLAFPIGISVDCVVAHNTPHKVFNNEEITEKSVVKVDFCLHEKGRIVDSARTMTKNHIYKPLQDASLDALNEAIKMSGPDVLLSEIGKTIEEIITSYEITLSETNETFSLVPVYDVCGHNLSIFRVHNNKAVPNVHFPTYRERMKVNEIFAIEPFVTWGHNRVEYLQKSKKPDDYRNLNHYAIHWNRLESLQKHLKEEVIIADSVDFKSKKKHSMTELLKQIYKLNYTLPFSPYDQENDFYDPAVFHHYKNSYFEELPVIKTINPSVQYEKTIGITESNYIIF